MRTVIWLVLLFAAAVVAASTLGRNDGLVSFYWGGWRLDVSLNLFIVGLVVTCFVLMSAFQGINALINLPVRAREWRLRRREQAAQEALREALAEYFGARYTRAQRAAQRALSIQEGTPDLEPDTDLRVLAHLLSAASSHRLQDRAGRDDQMKRLRKLARRGPADDGAQLMAAEWAIDDRDAGRALELLGALSPGVARRTQALRLRLQAARLARQPLEALRTARLLAKHQAFSPVAAQGLLRTLACEAIDTAHDVDQLRRVWQQLDVPDRRDPYIVSRAALRATELSAPDEARNWLRPLWDRIGALTNDERTQVSLALLDALQGIGADWLPRLEAALTAFSQDSAVALAVGAAFAERKLWGKARRPLEQAAASPTLDAAARRRAWHCLAELAREEADHARAVACEQAAAKLS